MTVGMVMASPVSSLTFSRCSSSSFTSSSQPSIYSLSSSLVSYPKTPKFHLSTWIRQLRFSSFQQWSGLKHLGISITSKSVKLEKNRRCKGREIHASLFGVGAPEALVIGVVALLVFGPKGLAEVARNLGKTLRAFQPTIRELQDVSREFKSTLEREIGIDDIQSTNTYSNFNRTNPVATPPSVASNEDSQTVVDPNGTPSPEKAYTSEDYLKITEEQLKASATQQQASSPPQGESQLEPKTQSQATTTDAVSPPRNPKT